MGLLDFVKSPDPSKIKTGERTFTPGEVPLLTKTADMVVNPSPQTIRLVTHTITDEINAHFGKNKRKVGASAGPPPIKKARTGGVSINEPAVTTVGKSPAVIQKLFNQANVDSEAVASVAEEFTSFSITPTPKRNYKDESVSNHDDNVRTCPPSDRYVVLSSSSTDTDILTSPQVVLPVLFVQVNAHIVATEPVDETHGLSVPRTKVGGTSILKNETGTSLCYTSSRNLVDHVPPPGYWASLCNLSDADFLDRMNLNSAQHVCMVSELRLRYEHQIALMEKFEKKFTNSSEVIQQRDAEVVELRTKLERAEGEAADVVELHRQGFELEATAAAKFEELAGLSVQNAELLGYVSGLESVRDGLNGKVVELEFECERLWSQVVGEPKLKEQFVGMQDVVVQRLMDCSSALDVGLSELNYQVDS
ncbi:hypothetical protein Tco_1339126, partial [Tanacetum coccineum]